MKATRALVKKRRSMALTINPHLSPLTSEFPMAAMFQKAQRKKKKARIAFVGPTGSGKSYSALTVARGLAGPEGRIAFLDSERGGASMYAGEVDDFDVMELTSFSVENYIAGIKAAVAGKYDVLIIDSLSHAWMGKDGVLEFVDKSKARGGNDSNSNSNSFTAWRKATPLHNELIDTILAAPIHVIATMRAKMEHVMEKDERTGKTEVRKIGLQPVQRDGLEYEFDVIGDINQDHQLVISKSRIGFLSDAVILKPSKKVGEDIRAWLDGGADEAPRVIPTEQVKEAPGHPVDVDEEAMRKALGEEVNMQLDRIGVVGKDERKAYVRRINGEMPVQSIEQMTDVLMALKEMDPISQNGEATP